MSTQISASPLPPPKERRRLRQSRSLTRAQLARRLGVARATVRAWESGRRAPAGAEGRAYTEFLGAFVPSTGPDAPSAKPAPGKPEPLTPAQAFDALCAVCAPALVRQT